MSLVRNARTKNWEADIRSDGLGRLHVSLRTKRKNEADDRHSAVKAMFLEGNHELIAALRAGKVKIEAVTRVHQAKLPFDSLLAVGRWGSLSGMADKYIAWMEQQTDKAEATRTAARQLLNQAITYFGADRALDTISHDDIEAYKTHLLERGVKPWTAGLHLTRLNALYTWARRQEERKAGHENRTPKPLRTPIDREIIPPRSAAKDRFLDRVEAQRLLASTPEKLLFPVAAGLLAGLRIGEVLSLRPPPQDFNLEVASGLVLVQEKEGWRPKSKKRRQIPIALELRPILDRHTEKYASTSWMLPSHTPKGRLRDDDKHWDRSILERHFKTIVEDAGLVYGQGKPGGVTFHTLRHTFASWLVMAGVDLYTVSKLLGHSTIALVEKTYGHLAPDHMRLAMGKLDASYRLELDTLNEGEGE